MANLIEGIQSECNSVRELITDYEALGPVGAFGAAVLRAAIKDGEAAIASGDVVAMIAALKSLQGCC